MTTFNLRTPVALLAFNRPDTTAQVFAAIREARPSRLFLIADGPRPDNSKDVVLCSEVRRILEKVDWPCEVMHNYSDRNVGCKKRVATGLNWVFEHVEEAIVLEDDCVPDGTFFAFCEEMLDFYWDNENIMMVCGTNLLGRWKDERQSYHFAHYDWVWGWATWRRAWQRYDIAMKEWSDPRRREKIRCALQDEQFYRMRQKAFQQAYDNRIDTWDYQWSFSRLCHEGLAIVPSVNLVSNIGYGINATHTKVHDKDLAAKERYCINLPLCHPNEIAVDREYDRMVVQILSGREKFMARAFRVISEVFLLFFKRRDQAR